MTALKLRSSLVALPRPAKRVILVAADIAILWAALTLALFYIGADLHAAWKTAWGQWFLAAGIAVPLFARAGFYRTMVRFGGNRVFTAVFGGITVVSLIMKAAQIWLPLPGFALPSPAIIIFWGLGGPMLIGSRLLARALLTYPENGREGVIIYGAGDAGAQLVSSLLLGKQFRPVAVVDDVSKLHGTLLHGVPVRSPEELPKLVRATDARRILLALPSIPRCERLGIIRRLETLPVQVQTVPDITDLVSGRARVDDLRDVDALDVLGREPVTPNNTLLNACVAGRSVMVTGAGGSIGSELCRQIAQLGPRRLVLLEISEPALYRIQMELAELIRQRGLQVELVALLGSTHYRDRVERIMRTWRVQTVYHAAAYKHVPIVEQNLLEGVHNNIIGTWFTAEAAEAAGVETFVLVSTDKAVSPVNVMGATKRFAELILQAMSSRGCRTRFCMVRFGNVLDSSGSVVPLFREQIRRGGPVTVTHPEVIRYFMTIPEAAQLVLQAGSMGRGGDVFVLDMGDPVRIADLARRMIQLSGLSVRDEDNPEGDVIIEYTGLRPGEKLYEELLIGNNVAGTDHPRILRAYEESQPWSTVHYYMEQLLEAAGRFDCQRAQQLLLESVNGFAPVCKGIEDLVWKAAHAPIARPVVAWPASQQVTVRSVELVSLPASPPVH